MSADLLVIARNTAQLLHARMRAAALPTPEIALILGSGLGGLVDHVVDAIHVPYQDIPGFPITRVAGHAGHIVLGKIDGVSVLVFAGRFHTYDGYPASVVGLPVRVAHAVGARTVFVSNAAGAINPAFTPGDLMIITDHINLTGTSPLVGPVLEGDTRFPDMSMPYDIALRQSLQDVAARHDLTLREGVYAGVLGPAYETRAEIRMLRTMGADAVAMSIIPEVITARALGMRVAGVSCITNMASGVTDTPLDHADVLRVTARVATQFQTLIRGFVGAIR